MTWEIAFVLITGGIILGCLIFEVQRSELRSIEKMNESRVKLRYYS
jgi:uncharacterized membrane-anchored protein YhcB (DUF1043 family)